MNITIKNNKVHHIKILGKTQTGYKFLSIKSIRKKKKLYIIHNKKGRNHNIHGKIYEKQIINNIITRADIFIYKTNKRFFMQKL